MAADLIAAGASPLERINSGDLEPLMSTVTFSPV